MSIESPTIPNTNELFRMTKDLESTIDWLLGENLFRTYPGVKRLQAESTFPTKDMPYKGNVVEFENGGEKRGFVRSTLLTALKDGVPYVAQEIVKPEIILPIKFGSIVACVRQEDLASPPILGIRSGVFAQADLEFASVTDTTDQYIDLNSRLIEDSVNWLVNLGLPPDQIQVRINDFSNIFLNVINQQDKNNINPQLVKMAWELLNDVDRSSFEKNKEKVASLKEGARELLQSVLNQKVINNQEYKVLLGWIDEGEYNPEVLVEFPEAKTALDILEQIKSITESNLQGTRIIISPNSYRITPYAYSGVTFQIDGIGLNGLPIAESGGGGVYSQTALDYWQKLYGTRPGNLCFTGIAFGLMRISSLLKK